MEEEDEEGGVEEEEEEEEVEEGQEVQSDKVTHQEVSGTGDSVIKEVGKSLLTDCFYAGPLCSVMCVVQTLLTTET